MQKEKILIVDAEQSVCDLLEERLIRRGYKVYVAKNTEVAFDITIHEKPNLIILEILLPNFDAYSFCYKIRETYNIPIIVLSGLGNLSDRIRGFGVGVHDYIRKPFSPKELEIRIRSLLRNKNNNRKAHKQNIRIANLVIDIDKSQAFHNDKLVPLTLLEFKILELLCIKAGKTLSRIQILKFIWSYLPERNEDTRVIDVHISRLRIKLKEDARKPTLILTVRGQGYKMKEI
jgi:DNA-binding response OmpR family regulator